MDWKTFLADLRIYLQDTGTTPKWSSELLYKFAVDAIRDYSQWLPRRIDRVTLTESGGAYPLPSDFISDIFVENPKDRFIQRRPERPGSKFYDRTMPLYYYVQGGNLYLQGTTDDEVLLTYFAVHDIPTDEKDNTFTFTIPDVDLELIKIYTKAQVHIYMRSKQSRLDRFKPTGNREDNPVADESSYIMDEYRSKLSERIPGKVIHLYYPGRRR